MRRMGRLRTFQAAAGIAAALWSISGAAAQTGGNRVLSVSVSGGGVVTTADERINCGSTCSASYRQGTVLRLTASPETSFEFVRWEGDCIGTAPICDVALDRAQSVSATFVGKMTLLSVSVGGPGRVGSSRGGISCGGTNSLCETAVPHATTVTLTPVPDANGRFAGWDGPCAAAGTGPCTLRVDSPRAETAAAFGHASPSPGQQPLTVSLFGPGVHVTSQPAGIDCPGACSASFDSGTLVTLSENAGSQWSGGCWGFLLRCSLVVDAPSTVLASRIPPPPVPPPPPPTAHFDVTVSGRGLVTSGEILKCGRSPNPRVLCEAYALPGRTFAMLAGARRGSHFAKWGGSCRVKKTICRIPIPGNAVWPQYALTALFRVKH